MATCSNCSFYCLSLRACAASSPLLQFIGSIHSVITRMALTKHWTLWLMYSQCRSGCALTFASPYRERSEFISWRMLTLYWQMYWSHNTFYFLRSWCHIYRLAGSQIRGYRMIEAFINLHPFNGKILFKSNRLWSRHMPKSLWRIDQDWSWLFVRFTMLARPYCNF